MIRRLLAPVFVGVVLLGMGVPTGATASDAVGEVQLQASDDAYTVTSDSSTTLLPKDADAGITIAVPGAPDLTLGIPSKEQQSASEVSATSVSYVSEDGGVDFVASALPDGFSVAVLVKDVASPERYDYSIDLTRGERLLPLDDGRVLVTDSRGKPLYLVAVPWARDAYGRPVPTYFEVNGDVLTQVVRHQSGGFAYPILADPAITFVPGLATDSYYLSRAWTRKVANGVARYQNASNAAIAAAFALACAPVGGVGAIVCAGAGAAFGGFAIDQFLEARQRNACIRIRTVKSTTAVTGIYVDNSGYCKNN